MKSLLLFVLGAFCGAVAMYVVELPQRTEPTIKQTATERAPGAATIPAITAPVSPPSATVAFPTSESGEMPTTASEGLPGPAGIAAETSTPMLASAAVSVSSPQALMIPVDGVNASQLQNTFDDARAAGRRHDAIDIMAPKGTRILAVADGKVAKLFTSVRGGLTVYEFDPSETYTYYYAHMDSYAPGLSEGSQLRRGDLIGFVGSTGDASATAPHLHFEISLLGPEKHWWQGTALNPYPILTGRQTLASAAATGAQQ